MADEQRLVLVLRIDERRRKRAEIAADVAEGSVCDLPAGDPEIDRSDAVAVLDKLMREAELRVELKRACLHRERARVRRGVRILVDNADADAEPREP